MSWNIMSYGIIIFASLIGLMGMILDLEPVWITITTGLVILSMNCRILYILEEKKQTEQE